MDRPRNQSFERQTGARREPAPRQLGCGDFDGRLPQGQPTATKKARAAIGQDGKPQQIVGGAPGGGDQQRLARGKTQQKVRRGL